MGSKLPSGKTCSKNTWKSTESTTNCQHVGCANRLMASLYGSHFSIFLPLWQKKEEWRVGASNNHLKLLKSTRQSGTYNLISSSFHGFVSDFMKIFGFETPLSLNQVWHSTITRGYHQLSNSRSWGATASHGSEIFHGMPFHAGRRQLRDRRGGRKCPPDRQVQSKQGGCHREGPTAQGGARAT